MLNLFQHPSRGTHRRMTRARDPCAYILASKPYGTIYIGVTSDLIQRLWQHREGMTGGFTSKIILDRANHRAVIVLSNTAAEVDTAANTLLVGEHVWIPSR